MAKISVCASVIPEGVETPSGVTPSVYWWTALVTNYLAPVVSGGSLTHYTEDGPSSLVASIENLASDCMLYSGLLALHDLSSGSHRRLFFPRASSFPNLAFVHAPDPLKGHSHLLHTLHVAVGTRGLTFVKNIPLLSTCCSDDVSSNVCNLLRRCPIYLLPFAYSARRSPLIEPANRILLEVWPPPIRCYKMCSNDSGHWCGDATSEVASDDAPS